MKPETEALAFRIWQYANAREWNLTVSEIAADLREPLQRVSRVVSLKCWGSRLRVTQKWQHPHQPPVIDAAAALGTLTSHMPQRINRYATEDRDDV